MASETDGGIQAVEAARNQALWREVNERIRLFAEPGSMEFVCECADMDCTETVHLSVAEYERIRSSPTRFPIAVGHDYPEFEDVVEVCDRYAVVEKRGKAAEVSAKLDQRSHKLPLSLMAPRRGMAGPETSRARPRTRAAVEALRRKRVAAEGLPGTPSKAAIVRAVTKVIENLEHRSLQNRED